MKKIETQNRLVKNIRDLDAYKPFVFEGYAERGTSVLQLDESKPVGYGFHVYKMAPGSETIPHVHERAEHFYVIEGDVTDHDGFEYKPGDLVMLKKGTEHNTRTRNGCTLVVYFASEDCP